MTKVFRESQKSVSGGDRLGLSQGLTVEQLTISQRVNDVTISPADELLATLEGVNVSSLSAERFTAV